MKGHHLGPGGLLICGLAIAACSQAMQLSPSQYTPNISLGSQPHGASPPSFSVLYKFGADSADGAYPVAGLTKVRETLYGTTSQGGAYRSCVAPYDCGGTVFSITTNGTEKVLHSFAGGSDGAAPHAALLNMNGTLYGTTPRGGAYDASEGGGGTVFSITTTGKEHVLYSFGSGSDGAHPEAGLIEVSGRLYGTTYDGGAYGNGAVFSITTTGKEHVLYSFGGGGDGAYPQAALTDVSNTLYGTTYSGGEHGNGTVFSIARTGKEHVLYSFGKGSDGARPQAPLIDVSNTLYGTTYYGGAHGTGTVFSITRGGAEKVLHSFAKGFDRPHGASEDGSEPRAGLLDVKGTLYGTTSMGGAHDNGTIFSITTSGTERVVHSLKGKAQGGQGVYPLAPLIDVDGTLYGTASSGGRSVGWGTVFALTP